MGEKKGVEGARADESRDGTKICLDCGFPVPLEGFHKDKSKPDGRHGVCKRCMKIRSRANYKKRKHKAAQQRAVKNRKDKIEALPNELTHEEWVDTLEWFNHCCAYCGRPIKEAHEKGKTKGKDKKLEASKEHIVPVDDGGPFVKWNIIPACKRCNTSKGNRRFIEWYITRPYFSMERLERIVIFMRKYKHGLKKGNEVEVEVGVDRANEAGEGEVM